MRAKVLLPLFILALGVTILLLEAPPGITQGFPSKKGGKSGFKSDAGLYFDKMAQGKDFIVITGIRDPDRRDELTLFAKKVGISDDKITRDQYLRFFEMRDEIRAGLSFDKMSQGKGFLAITALRDPDRRDELTLFAKKVGISDDKITRDQYLRFFEMRDEIRAGLSFDKMSQGKGFFVISEVRDRGRKEEMTLFAKNVGINDDRITRDQYLQFLEMREQIREALRSGGPLPGTKPPAVDPDRQFKGYDRNGDGFLSKEEIQSTVFFKNEWEKWDANKDSKITLEEWRAYSLVRDQQLQQRKSSDTAKSTGSGGIDVITIDHYTRPENWRAGKLPDGLPDWFKEYDLNKDGQVALYEWRQKSTEPISKFLAMDANDDGLLTPEELLRFQRGTNATANGQKTQATKSKGKKSGK
jgi:hypothetical protein